LQAVETVAYMLYPGKIYLNITNRCSNRCNFCVRNYTDELAGYYLWLTEEPSVEKIIDSIREELFHENYSVPEEIIFCGYGEPFYRPVTILNVLQGVKNLYPDCKLRINTNGQSLLINRGKSYLPESGEFLDAISISLNAHNSKVYEKICNPVYGEKAFYSVVEFAGEAVKYIESVTLTVVGNGNYIDIDKSMEIAHKIGASFRIR
jgi:TatD family-associated radical SAM protein